MAKLTCPVAKVECQYLYCQSGKRCARKSPPPAFKRASTRVPSLFKPKGSKKK